MSRRRLNSTDVVSQCRGGEVGNELVSQWSGCRRECRAAMLKTTELATAQLHHRRRACSVRSRRLRSAWLTVPATMFERIRLPGEVAGQPGDQGRPSSLMTGTDASAVVAMQVFVE